MNSELREKIEKLIGADPRIEDGELAYKLRQALDETELPCMDKMQVKDIASLVADSMCRFDDEAPDDAAVNTGFESLDMVLGGLRPGEFVVVGGRPAMGKTLFLVNLARNIAGTFPVLFVTYDLSARLLTHRFLSSASEIPLGHIVRNDMDEHQKQRLADASDELTDLKLFISEDCPSSISALKALCREHIQENGVKIIIVDYLQMLSSLSKYHRGNREAEMSYICRELKKMAKENDVCFIVSSQLNRSVESRGGSKRPQLSDLRDSGAIEQDADKVLFIHRPEYYGFTVNECGIPTSGIAEIIVAKNRIGALDVVKLQHDDNFTKFTDHKEDTDNITQFTFSEERLLELGEKPF